MKIIVTAVLLMLVIGGVTAIIAQKMNDSPAKENDWPPEVVAKVEGARSARAEVQQQHPQLFAKVTEAMFRHDPIEINFETNTDEYDAEAGTVIPRLRDCSSSEDVVTVLHEEFSAWFGADTVGSRDRYSKLGSEIWHLWKTDQTEQVVAPNGP